ncbi:MAG: DUF3850 domain-containing protein [Pseudomonadales bacterium]|nr:DUF3850 domain-containing protein [Pseudomonadales bacterium]
MHHELKIIPVFFESVICGEKTFEVRDNKDRGFQKGDTVLLREFDPSDSGSYSGRQQLVSISYVSSYNQPINQVVFGFSLLGDFKNFEAAS